MLEAWHYAIAAMLALAPSAFAFWDWLDRQDRYRLPKLRAFVDFVMEKWAR